MAAAADDGPGAPRRAALCDILLWPDAASGSERRGAGRRPFFQLITNYQVTAETRRARGHPRGSHEPEPAASRGGKLQRAAAKLGCSVRHPAWRRGRHPCRPAGELEGARGYEILNAVWVWMCVDVFSAGQDARLYVRQDA